MRNPSRRNFLLRAGTVIANVAAPALLSLESPLILADLITPAGGLAPARAALAGTVDSDSKKTVILKKKMRRLMVDAARVPETIEFYKRVVEFCAEWGFNTLQFSLESMSLARDLYWTCLAEDPSFAPAWA